MVGSIHERCWRLGRIKKCQPESRAYLDNARLSQAEFDSQAAHFERWESEKQMSPDEIKVYDDLLLSKERSVRRDIIAGYVLVAIMIMLVMVTMILHRLVHLSL